MRATPVDAPLTQRFGANPAAYARFGFKGHEGDDYGAYYQPVYAKKAGWVGIASYSYGAYGVCVIVRRPDNTAQICAHLSRIDRSVGVWVNEGEQIGLSGNTGNSSGPHEHDGLQRQYLQNLNDGWWGCIDPQSEIGASMASDAELNAVNLRLTQTQLQVQALVRERDSIRQQLTDTQVQVEQLRNQKSGTINKQQVINYLQENLK